MAPEPQPEMTATDWRQAERDLLRRLEEIREHRAPGWEAVAAKIEERVATCQEALQWTLEDEVKQKIDSGAKRLSLADWRVLEKQHASMIEEARSEGNEEAAAKYAETLSMMKEHLLFVEQEEFELLLSEVKI